MTLVTMPQVLDAYLMGKPITERFALCEAMDATIFPNGSDARDIGLYYTKTVNKNATEDAKISARLVNVPGGWVVKIGMRGVPCETWTNYLREVKENG